MVTLNIASVILVIIVHQISAQECKPQSSGYGFTYPRIFTVLYDGPPLIFANRSLATTAMGNCFNPDDIAKEMFEYFEAHGADLSEVKDDPFNRHDNDNFQLGSSAHDPKEKRIANVITTTLYETSRFTDTHLHIMTWTLIAKRDFTGPKGSLPAGHRMLFGAYRFLLHNKDFCIKFNSAIQIRVLDVTTGKQISDPGPFHLELRNTYLGEGEAIGLVLLVEGKITVRFVMTFPA